VLYKLFTWLVLLGIAYTLCLYSYTNLSSEGFVFIVEGLYLFVSIIVINTIYTSTDCDGSKYKEYIKSHYEQLFICTECLKKLNIKTSIIYKWYH